MRTKTLTLKSTVDALIAGDPMELAITTKGTLPNGNLRSISQVVKVLDDALQKRLKRQVKPGDEVLLTIATEFGAKQIRSFVMAFERVSAPART